jgi:hypothetical protein
MNDKPRSSNGYTGEDLARVHATCLYVATALGDFLDHITVVGGLVPSLLIGPGTLRPDQAAYVGTLDLDLALGLALLERDWYKEIAGRLRSAGFVPDISPSGNPTPQRWVVSSNRGPSVRVEFLIAPIPGSESDNRIFHLETDLAAIVVPGIELAFHDRQYVQLEGKTIQGDAVQRSIWVCGPGAFIVLKAIAYRNRGEPKDAYDLFYVLQNYGDGLETIATRIRPHAKKPLVTRALRDLSQDFQSPNHKGPRDVARFTTGRVSEDLQADVSGLVRELIRMIGIEDTEGRNGILAPDEKNVHYGKSSKRDHERL